MVQFRKGPANRIWNVGMFTGTALVPNGMPGGVRGRVITGPTRFILLLLTLFRSVIEVTDLRYLSNRLFLNFSDLSNTSIELFLYNSKNSVSFLQNPRVIGVLFTYSYKSQ